MSLPFSRIIRLAIAFLEYQGDEIPLDNKAAVEVAKQEVVGFVGDVVGDSDHQTTTFTPIDEDIYVPSFELKSFLERPVRLTTYTIELGEAFNFRRFRPWHDYLASPAIAKKLDNFAYIQGDLHLKFMINSTPFIYGQYMASYLPLTSYTRHLDYGNDATWANTWEIRVPLSQRQHVIVSSVGNEGAEMTLPYFFYKNWASATSADEMNSLGVVDVVPLVPFRSANTTTAKVTLVVMAWMTNVKLAGQTISLALQSDEYATGPISRPASIVASIGKKLSDVPVIGKFAKATAFAGNAVSKIASLFGFTNVPVIDNSQPIKHMLFHSLASAQIAGPIDKLSLDPKAELTIDPSTLGLQPTDELAISNLATKWSLLTGFSWYLDGNVDDLLFSANVGPTMSTNFGVSTGKNVLLDTPMGWLSRLFLNWRGDLEFKVVFIASPFHQGRVRASFDPAGNASTTASSTVVQTKICDLADSNEFTFRIPYMAPSTWLNIKSSAVNDWASNATLSGYDKEVHNGRFDIRILTNLTAPTNTAYVDAVVYVRAAENFEVANPSPIEFNASLFVPQSDEIVLGQVTSVPEDRYLENFGEQVASLRPLMRRHTLSQKWRGGVTGKARGYSNVVSLNLPMYPPEYGFNDNGQIIANKLLTTGTALANFCPQSAYTWISPAFAGQRGSMNYALQMLGDKVQEFRVVRNTSPQTEKTTSQEIDLTTYSEPCDKYPTLAGASLTDTNVQPSLQYCVPFMNKFKFVSTNPDWRYLGYSLDNSDLMGSRVSWNYVSTAANSNFLTNMSIYYGIGTDFTLFNFVNVPLRWKYTMTPATA